MALGIAFFDSFSLGKWYRIDRYNFSDDCQQLHVVYPGFPTPDIYSVSDLEEVDGTICGMFADEFGAFMLGEIGE